MNMTKRIAAALTAMTLCFSLTACGGNGGNAGGDAAKGKTPAEQVASAVEKLNAAKNFSLSMQQDIGMSMKMAEQSQDLTYAMDMDMDVFQSPKKAKGKVTIDMGDLGGKQETEMYMKEADGEVFVYIGMNGQWVKQSADVEGMEMYDIQDTMDLYLDNASDFKEAGSEQVNGAEATKISGVIKGDKLEEVLEESGIMNMVEQFVVADATEDTVEKILSSLGDMPMTVWVSAEGYPVQYEMDMTAMLSGVMESAMKAAGAAEQGVSMQVSNAKISMTCSNFDSAPDFELPAELENATDMAA